MSNVFIQIDSKGFWIPENWIFTFQLCLYKALIEENLNENLKKNKQLIFIKNDIEENIAKNSIIEINTYLKTEVGLKIIKNFLYNLDLYFRLGNYWDESKDTLQRIYDDIKKRKKSIFSLKKTTKIPLINLLEFKEDIPFYKYQCKARGNNQTFFFLLRDLFQGNILETKELWSIIEKHDITSFVHTSRTYDDDYIVFTKSTGYKGVLDKNKALFLEPGYNSIQIINSNLLFLVYKQNNTIRTYSILNTNKEVIATSNSYEYLSYNKEINLLLCSKRTDNKLKSIHGILSLSLEELVPTIYQNIIPITLESQFYIVKLKDRQGILNSNFKEIYPIVLESIYPSTNNSFLVKDQEGWFLINHLGEIMSRYPYDLVTGVDIRSLFDNVTQTNIDQKRLFLVHGREDKKHQYEDPFIKYQGKWGVCNSEGKAIIPARYDYISVLGNSDYYRFHKGVLDIKYIDRKVDDVIFQDEILKNFKTGILDQNGNEVIPPIYDWLKIVESPNNHPIFIFFTNATISYFTEDWHNEIHINNAQIGILSHDNCILVPNEYQSYSLQESILCLQKSPNFNKEEPYDTYDLSGNFIEHIIPTKEISL